MDREITQLYETSLQLTQGRGNWLLFKKLVHPALVVSLVESLKQAQAEAAANSAAAERVPQLESELCAAQAEIDQLKNPPAPHTCGWRQHAKLTSQEAVQNHE